jgi:tRNA-modifying protein YgfZ
METAGIVGLGLAYEAAHQRSLAVPRPPARVLRAAGATRLDLIQRLSTNDLSGIGENEVRPTILTTAIGRIVDRLAVFARGDELWLIPSPGRDRIVMDWLQRHIFFQDDVHLSPLFPSLEEWFVVGPEGPEHVRQALGIPEVPAAGHGLAIPGGLVLGTVSPEPPGMRMVFDSSRVPSGVDAWREGQDEEAARAAFEAVRIEAGFPEYGREFDDGDIPLETGLTYAVSSTKGCYLGQEIIARMESRARIPRRLMGGFLEGPHSLPADITSPEGLRGSLTSVAYSPRHGWIGLAVIRSAAAGESKGFLSPSEEIRLMDLPFPSQPPEAEAR